MKKKSLLFIVSLFSVLFFNKLNAQNIYTFAGIAGAPGYAGDGGYSTMANLSGPAGIVTDTFGNVYFCDTRNNVIRKITTSGIISTIAGDGTVGYSGDGGAAVSAILNRPAGIAIDRIGNLFICDNSNNVIRKIDTAGIINTIAGNNTPGYSGDGAAATDAQLNRPSGIVVDNFGNVYISDTRNSVIRKVNNSGIITTIAGTGFAGYSGDGAAATLAQFSRPIGITRSSNGKIYIADSRNNVIRLIDTFGIVHTFAGSGTSGYGGDGGPATSANLHTPNDVKIDVSGNIFISDSSHTVRKVGVNDTIYTYAGTGIAGFYGDGGPATLAKMTMPDGIAIDRWHNLYISTVGNNVIRRVGMPVTGIHITSTLGDTICYGTTVHFIATPIADSTPHYQWTVNGLNVGTDSFKYTPTSMLAAGSLISCQLLDSVGGVAVATSNTLRIDSLPRTGTITGPSVFCLGDSANLTYAGGTPGGTWIMSNPTLASLLPPRRVKPLAPGLDTVFYVLSNVCGRDTAKFPFTITDNNVGPIQGPSKICTGSIVPFTDTTLGGIWSARPFFYGTIDSFSGTYTAGPIPGRIIITYYATGACSVTDTVYIVSLGPISGPSSLCGGSVGIFTDTSVGGTWSTSPLYGTIDSLSGTFTTSTTITGGYAIINYGVSSACFVSDTVSVSQMSPITGALSSICVGGTTTFADSVAGGTWSAFPATLGTINATNGYFFAGYTVGEIVISYTLASGCMATDTLYINVIPVVDPISGPTIVDSASTITLTSTTGGGVWSSSNTSIATVNPSTGVVTGVATGVVTITYFLYNDGGCSNYATYTDTVVNKSGIVNIRDNKYLQIFPNPANNTLNILWNNGKLGKYSMVISNEFGISVYKTDIDINSTSGNKQINVASLNQGVYIIRLISDKEEFSGVLQIIR